MRAQWAETFVGGSPEAEQQHFEKLARDIMRVQLTSSKVAGAHGVPHGVDRAFHAKSTLALEGAELRFRDDLDDDLRAGFVQPGASYPVTVRFSNASGVGGPDTAPDLRGVALRVEVSPDESHDLLMTNWPVSHARDAHQFVEFAKATAGGKLAKLLGILRLLRVFGPSETLRMLRNVTQARRRTVTSVATETYWSRGAMRWGPDLAVRYLLRPAADTPAAPGVPTGDPGYLSTEAARRLRLGRRAPRALRPAVRRRAVDAHRGHRRRLGRPRRAPRAGRRADAAAGRRHRGRGDRDGPAHRDAGLQPVEHHRGVPPAREHQPGPQGGLRRQLGAPARLPVGDHVAAAQRGRRRRRAGVLPGREPVRRLAPAAAAPRAPEPRRVPARAARRQPDRHRDGRGAARRTPGPARRSGRAGPGRALRRRHRQRPVRARRWGRWVRRSAATWRRTTGRTCSTSPARSRSAGSCSTATTSSRPGR